MRIEFVYRDGRREIRYHADGSAPHAAQKVVCSGGETFRIATVARGRDGVTQVFLEKPGRKKR